MEQQLALAIMLSGESALLTGPAGSGKTYLLNRFIEQARAQGRVVSVTATTGLAATHLGGATIHAWSGLGVLDTLPPRFVDNLAKGRREVIARTDVLVIDEISMLHDYRLDMVDEVCRLVRGRPDEPFGGIQVVMSGDFFQLPPINRDHERAGGFVVGSVAWQGLDPAVCYLASQHRQEDGALADILTAMRAGDLRRHHAQALLDRVGVAPPDEAITELHTTNLDVDAINDRRLEALPGEVHQYIQTTSGQAAYVQSLQRSVLAPAVLRLKLGALVMAVKNDPARRYVNGSIGTVVGFEAGTEYPLVRFHNGRTITMQPDTWEQRDGTRKRASIAQIPLRLAWAMTVHKSQGMTLDAARIDLRKAFVEGMGYVALSRVRRLDSLYLHGINRMALRMNPAAHQIDINLRARSDQTAAQYQGRRLARPKPDANVTVASSTPAPTNAWSARVARLRQMYPNAYRPWTAQADAVLQAGLARGEDIATLSSRLGRPAGAIRSRVHKQFGDAVDL